MGVAEARTKQGLYTHKFIRAEKVSAVLVGVMVTGWCRQRGAVIVKVGY